ncbi:MAG: MEDS domain-containing protein [Planctomycetota bacterium]|jgi:PAS domain S-box-containing protein
MEEKVRRTAIDVVGDVPWGTHFCQFYQTKEDLIDMLVPYFKVGLENNEFCMWITSEPLDAEDAHRALKKKVKNLDDYIKKGQIEIVDYRQWYTQPGFFDSDEVLQRWIEKEKDALKKGFDGLRFTGNTFWPEKRDWGKFTDYEAVVNNVIGKYRMLGICTYSLDKCTASEIIDVVSNHQFALIKQEGEWKIIESSDRKKAGEVLKLHEMRLQALLDLNKMAGASEQKILDFVREEVIKVTQSQFGFIGFMNEDESVLSMDNWSKNTMAQCAIVEKTMDFTIAEAGLWGEPVRQRKPVIINDYNAPHPAKKGFPRGHVPIERFLGIPVFDGELIVAVGAVANKAKNYDESDVRAVTSMMNDTWRLIRRKRAERALQKSEANYRAIFESANDAIFVHDIESAKILSVNEKACQMYGYTQEEFERLTIEDISTGEPPQTQENTLRWIKKAVDEGPQLFEWICKHKTGRKFWVEVNLRLAVIEGRKRVLAIVRDITERKDMEAHQQLAGQILECLNRESIGVDLIRDVLKLIRKATSFDAAGIRQREGKDFPYLEVDGFPDDFVKSENYLCAHDEAGELIYDSGGRPVIECMCGNVLSNRANPTLPFFTEGGSFWTNSTTELLACTAPEALQVPTRNHCNKAGYESVALIPLRSGDEIIGLLQLNDTRRGRFTPEMVRLFEEIGASIGIGMARIRAEREVENLAKFPSENPYPVLRIAKDGTILYANTAGSELLVNWSCKVGEQAPGRWQQDILRILKSGLSEDLEVVCKNRIFSLIIAPVTNAGYVNVYGIDITERKHAEEDLRKYRHHLEDLVQTRTVELTQANKQLLQEIEERKRLEKEILNISEREQRRIGRELHDSIGQQFTGIAFMMKVLEQKLATKLPDEATDAAEITKLVSQAMDQTRGLAKGLHPVDLDANSLTPALQELTATTENMFSIHCAFKCDKPVLIDDAELATHLYRITQEAITNAIKHGKAKNIRVELDRERDKSVLTVENDGLDFPEEFEARGTGMGLQIMDHRADIIGASLDIHKATKGGTIMTCSFPNKTH